MSYTTQSQIEGYMGRKLTAEEAVIIPTVIGAVTDWIDKVTGQSWATVDGESRIYDGGGGEFLFIDPIIDITSVEYLNLDGTVNYTYDVTVPDYVSYPLNGKTITRLKIAGGRNRWPRGNGRIKITGKWGSVGGVPDDIRLAATITAADWLSNEDKLKSESIEGYSRTFQDTADHNPQVDAILASRRRIVL